MKEIKLSNGTLALGFIIVAFIIFFLTRKTLKTAKLESEAQVIIDQSKITISENTAKKYCTRVVTDSYWFARDTAVYGELLALKEADLMFVNNVWAKNFLKSNGNQGLGEFIKQNNLFINDDMENLINRLVQLTGKTK